MLPSYHKGNDSNKFTALKSLRSFDFGQQGPVTRRQSSYRAAEMNKALPVISVDLSSGLKDPSSFLGRQQSILRRRLEDMESEPGKSMLLDYGSKLPQTISIDKVEPTNSVPSTKMVKV